MKTSKQNAENEIKYTQVQPTVDHSKEYTSIHKKKDSFFTQIIAFALVAPSITNSDILL